VNIRLKHIKELEDLKLQQGKELEDALKQVQTSSGLCAECFTPILVQGEFIEHFVCVLCAQPYCVSDSYGDHAYSAQCETCDKIYCNGCFETIDKSGCHVCCDIAATECCGTMICGECDIVSRIRRLLSISTNCSLKKMYCTFENHYFSCHNEPSQER